MSKLVQEDILLKLYMYSSFVIPFLVQLVTHKTKLRKQKSINKITYFLVQVKFRKQEKGY